MLQEDTIPANLSNLYKLYPKLIVGLFSRLNLDYPGLGKVKNEVLQHQWVAACQKLIDYYKRKSEMHPEWFMAKTKDHDTASINRANNVLRNVFTFQHVTGHQETRKNGQLNWYYLGPRNDKEWGYFLNRQGYFSDLLTAYKTTGKVVYSKKFSDLVSDWVLTNPAPDKKVSTETWRELEVGLRLTGYHWPKAFYGFQSSSAFSAVSRILMLSSIPEQADYILKYHRMHSNWASMELNGLATAAFYWPEFTHAIEWRKHAINKMEEEMEYEVYPDGAQNELTSHYHEVALNNFEAFADLAEKGGWKIPETFRETIEKMYRYLAFTIRPDGYGLLNNDSNLDFNRDKIFKASKKYGHKDWKYIATSGREGQKPGGYPTVFFPFAGQMIMRSGWHANAEWAFFDVGPWGNAHQHNDKLHLSVSAFGHDWLVDAGRYYYKWDEWRKYFISSSSHNVVLIGGKGQRPYQKLSHKPIMEDWSIQKNLSFCMGSYTNGFGSPSDKALSATKHTRAVIYLNNSYWIIVDHISGPKNQTIEPLWHFAPECTVKIKDNNITAIDSGHRTLQIIPSSPLKWKAKLIMGEQKPVIQGWYSREYNKKTPNFCADYKRITTDTATTFAWVIYPSDKGKKEIKIHTLKASPGAYRLKISIANKKPIFITVNFYINNSVSLSGGFSLIGRCAVIGQEPLPSVACGVIKDNKGNIIVTDAKR